MKKFVIRCDIEGVTGVTSYDQADPGKALYPLGKRMLENDLEAVCCGLNEGGADEILVYDEHFDGRNVDPEVLPDNASVICGKPPYTPENPGGLDASCTGLILVGFHSKAGTGELLAHSYEPDILDIRINGISVGEIGVEAAVAGDFGVPLAMITGDSAGIAEAQALVPGVFGVAVKDSLGPLAGCCRPAGFMADVIADTAQKLAEQGPAAKPWKVGSPVFEITLADTPYGRRYQEMFGPCRIAGKTASECWSIYWNRKLEVFGSLAK